MKKKILLFDLDGTLTDPKIGITKSVQYALRYFHIQVDDLDTLCPFIGPPLRQSFHEYYGLDGQQIETAIKKYREYFAEKGLFENIPYEGIRAFLERQKDAGKTLILATSKPQIFAEQILEHFNLKKYFTFISGSELDGRREDKGEVIAYALNQNGITEGDKASALMIGDRKYDVEGAGANGLECLGVLYGYGSREELEAAGPTYMAMTIQEMEDTINRL